MEYSPTSQRLMDLLRLLGDVVQEDAAALFLQRLVRTPTVRLAAAPRALGTGLKALQRYDVALGGWIEGVVAQLGGHRDGAVIAAWVRASSSHGFSGDVDWRGRSDVDMARHVVALEEAAQLVGLYAEALLGR